MMILNDYINNSSSNNNSSGSVGDFGDFVIIV